MSRLFVGNFSFEQARDRGYNSTQQVAWLEAELACVWLAVAQPGDEILCPVSIGSAYWERMEQLGCPPIRSLTLDTLKSTRANELIPWGWTPAVRQLAEQLKLPVSAPEQELVWQVNSRETAFELCDEIDCLVAGEGIARSLEEAHSLISRLIDRGREWLVKPNHAQAGRGQLRGTSLPAGKVLSTLARLIDRQGAVHVEPVLESLMEVSGQWQLPRQGAPQFLGLTHLLTDSRGGYAGSRIGPLQLPGNTREILLQGQSAIVARLQQRGYFGPVGIDAMLFRGENGREIRPIQDINARWTMGRIAWEWSRRRSCLNWTPPLGNPPEICGTMRQAETVPTLAAIPLSPDVLDGMPVRNRSWWIDQESEKSDVST